MHRGVANQSVMTEEEDLPPIFREEACKRFAELQCQDLDLLHIGQMIAREGNSLASVGACLRIEGKVSLEIEKDDSCPKPKDKIHKILLQWQWKNTGNATWASLIRSLQDLEEQNLMESIRKYLSKKEYPMEGMPSMQQNVNCRLYTASHGESEQAVSVQGSICT